MDLNRIELIGRVATAPKRVDEKGNRPFTQFRLAVNRPSKSTQWFFINVFGRLGQIVAKYTKKGDSLYVDGTVAVTERKLSGGQSTERVYVVAKNVIFLGVSHIRRPSESEPVDENANGEG